MVHDPFSRILIQRKKKMKTTFLIVCAFLLTLGAAGCDSFVENVDDPINTVDDALLNNQNQVNFIVAGVQSQFALVYGQLGVFSGGLSDELFFDRNVIGATYPQYDEMDRGDILVNNNSVIEVERDLGQLRLYADTLVGRVPMISWTDTTLMYKALYHGNLYAAIARYFYASYFGLNPSEGGGAINLSPFIPSADLYTQALSRLDAALPYAADAYEERLVHSIKARIHLYLNQFSQAESEATQGLTAGDAPLEALYSSEAQNSWWIDAGSGRMQWAVDPRYAGYVAADPAEASRIPLLEVTGQDDSTIFYKQNKYPQDASPVPFITSQEMDLIRAEVSIRNGQDSVALQFVNAARATHSIAPMTGITLDSIYIEREKELFCMGTHLMDQRRFTKWHLPSGTWMFLPITQREREANPNFD
jgi:starch-binding outer membrane protein, SusD/RagB family